MQLVGVHEHHQLHALAMSLATLTYNWSSNFSSGGGGKSHDMIKKRRQRERGSERDLGRDRDVVNLNQVSSTLLVP